MTRHTKSACSDLANTEPNKFVAPAAAHQRDDPAGRLAECRQYLLMIANEVIGPELRAKLGASDLVQDTFLEAHRHLAIFRGKSARRDPRVAAENPGMPPGQHPALIPGDRDACRQPRNDAQSNFGRVRYRVRVSLKPAPSPSNHAVRNEWNAALEQALTRLPDHYRQAVASRHIEQLSWDEIGSRMGCSADAARKVWSRAVQQLRRELAIHESIP